MSVSMVFVPEFLFSGKKCFFRKDNAFEEVPGIEGRDGGRRVRDEK